MFARKHQAQAPCRWNSICPLLLCCSYWGTDSYIGFCSQISRIAHHIEQAGIRPISRHQSHFVIRLILAQDLLRKKGKAQALKLHESSSQQKIPQ